MDFKSTPSNDQESACSTISMPIVDVADLRPNAPNQNPVVEHNESNFESSSNQLATSAAMSEITMKGIVKPRHVTNKNAVKRAVFNHELKISKQNHDGRVYVHHQGSRIKQEAEATDDNEHHEVDTPSTGEHDVLARSQDSTKIAPGSEHTFSLNDASDQPDGPLNSKSHEQVDMNKFCTKALRFYFWNCPFLVLLQECMSGESNFQTQLKSLLSCLEPALVKKNGRTKNKSTRNAVVLDIVGAVLRDIGPFTKVDISSSLLVRQKRMCYLEGKKVISEKYESALKSFKTMVAMIGFVPSVYWQMPAVYVFGLMCHFLNNPLSEKADLLWTGTFQDYIDETHKIPYDFVHRFFELHVPDAFKEEVGSTSECLSEQQKSATWLPCATTRGVVLNLKRKASIFELMPIYDLGHVLAYNFVNLDESITEDIALKHKQLHLELQTCKTSCDLEDDFVCIEAWDNIYQASVFASQFVRVLEAYQEGNATEFAEPGGNKKILHELRHAINLMVLSNTTRIRKTSPGIREGEVADHETSVFVIGFRNFLNS